ncbi:hypothetical protein QOT17_001348 [Balamuthia mandrillaris]
MAVIRHQNALLLLVCSLVLFAATLSSAADLQFTTVPFAGYSLSWGIDEAAEEITFELNVEQPGGVWVAVGWHAVGSSDDAMTNADFVVCTFNDSTHVNITDRYANANNKGFTAPVLDTTIGGVDNILSPYGAQISSASSASPSTITVARFTRKLNTGDKADHPITPGEMKVVAAIGRSNNFGFHAKAKQILVNFFTGASSESTTNAEILKQYHGAVMTLAFGVLLTFGVFVARYHRPAWYWFFLHAFTQLMALILAISGLAVIVATVQNHGSGHHFDNVHARFGLATLLMTCLVVPALGLWAHIWRDPTRKSPRVFPNRFHYWLGRLTWVMGLVAVFLGLHQYGANAPFFVLFGVFIGAAVLLALFVELIYLMDRFGLFNKYKSKGKVQMEETRPILQHSEGAADDSI